MDLRPTAATLDAAQQVLSRLQTLFDAAIDALARQCGVDGKLDAPRLDAWQFVSYELATASAELLAAQTAIGHADSATPLDARLAIVFAAEAAASVLAKLELAGLELSLDKQALHVLASGPELARLRQAGASGAALASAGRAVAQSGAEIGQVELDEGLAMAQDAFRRLGADVVAPMAEKIHRQDMTVPESMLQPMRDMGVFGLSIPEQYGGSAPEGRGEASMMVVVTEALSEASLAAAGSLITRPEILARALLSGGTEAQKSRWLPGIAAGSPLCAIAITEPDYGSDVASLTLKATATPGGWLLNGAKTWCTFAGKAGVLMVVARTGTDPAEGYRGLSILLVEKPSSEGHEFTHVQEAGGRLQGRAIPTIGYRGMHSFDLSFENFFVPQDNVIGGEGGLGKGFYFTMAGMMGGRMQTAARASGVMRAALRAAIQYAGDRKVFGAPLIDFPLTQTKIAKMAARFAACRRLAYTVARLLDSGGGRMEASLVKLLACRSAEYVTREALQIHGGMGYAEESAVSRYFVDARVLSIFEGAEETLALKVIIRSLLEGALERAGH
ncbi:MAG: acyl-CoA dehydrogenase family protein [Burkholderiaceae bacterium]|nr:acyl-CoA dehydrogenase family protein [Burkholderiaceae bacterium]